MIKGDVLITKGDVAFLIGGNHSVLKYLTGELTPTLQSLDAFAKNIASRKKITDQLGIPYAHVIFPDKQSVMSESFPFQPVLRLGDKYMDHLLPPLEDCVLYTADHLIREAKLDTRNNHDFRAVIGLVAGIAAKGVT